MASIKPLRVPLLPLRDIIVFPNTVVPLFVGREKSIKSLGHAMENGKKILLASQIEPKTNDPELNDLYNVGTLANILQLLKLPDGTVKVLVEGSERADIKKCIEIEGRLMVEYQTLKEPKSVDPEQEAHMRTVKLAFDNYVRLNKRIAPDMLLSIASIDDASKLADSLVAHLTNLKLDDKQALLEEIDPVKRLDDIYTFIQSEIEIIRVEKKIRSRVKRQMEKTQKEYYLNEQMSAIQKELGERDDAKSEIVELETKMKNKKLPKEVKERVKKELKKLKMMSSMSAEATVVRNYIDNVLDLPWLDYKKEIRDINFASDTLDADHYGLKKVKERILEYLSVRALVETIKGPIICLVGPPGVGKTSLAKSIATATGRDFVRIALGGVRDEAEIRGHRRTYIGAMPGKIIHAIKKSGSSNPVVLLDETDKLANDHRGDPASALLEVLDPEQNNAFVDHYLDLDYDLSKVLFMATANDLSTIPGPLRDRMEVIQLSGYTEEEKVSIATQYLVPKQIKANGLEKQKVVIGPKAVKELVRYYTREAGVRGLERKVGSLCRKVAKKHLAKLTGKKARKIKAGEIVENVTDKAVQKYLGPRDFRIGLQNKQHEIGLCTGLAWTQVGGDILVIEVSVFPGKGKIQLTGKLGDVMQESAKAALTYVKSRAVFLGIPAKKFDELDIHIHVPEGATPKDGPSAGIAMVTALTSALTEKPVSKDVAMTGEITLRGRVLPIGGLKEKILAAHRGGIKKIIIPIDNEKDLHEIPQAVMKDLTIVPCEHVDKVLIHALVWAKPETKEEDELYENLLQANDVKASDLEFLH